MSKNKLTQLGSKVTNYPSTPKEATLEAIPFDNSGNKNTIHLSTDEFTSLCPVTNQPDFGEISIEYIPHKKIVESKSLKLYLFSFRNVGMFQEKIVNIILNDLKKALKPQYIKVIGEFKPRGGIFITPVAEWSKK